MSDEILNCPFCGAKARQLLNTSIACENIFCMGEALNATAWNQRAETAQLRADLDESQAKRARASSTSHSSTHELPSTEKSHSRTRMDGQTSEI